MCRVLMFFRFENGALIHRSEMCVRWRRGAGTSAGNTCVLDKHFQVCKKN
jgi:hypothetical protein